AAPPSQVPGVEEGLAPAAAAVIPAPVPPGPAAAPPAPSPPAAASEVDEQSHRITASLGRSVLAWFRGGNAIVRIGVLILFLGVAFLLRYAAEHALLPVELRIAGVAAGGVVLAGLGWRLRERRRGYGLTLQGAGVGILYLTIFAAFRLYGLVP